MIADQKVIEMACSKTLMTGNREGGKCRPGRASCAERPMSISDGIWLGVSREDAIAKEHAMIVARSCVV